VTCPFCHVPPDELIIDTPLVIGFYDRFPVSPRHVLLVTRRHVEGWLDASDEERVALTEATKTAMARIESEPGPVPDGYNIGINSGRAAGQTVMHLHLHVIPRFAGDIDDPRGGIRGAIPHKRIYPSEVP
jgi:diadenosine tetraphosphate (Ap4A) HIT family hydrolase